MLWDGELQIHAGESERVCLHQRLERPVLRRIQPGHRYVQNVTRSAPATQAGQRLLPTSSSASRLGALRSLQKIYNWCAQADLHAMTASEFAKLSRDSYRTRVFKRGPRRWRLVNQGKQTTFRLPASRGEPDMAESSGIIGFKRERQWLYIYTAGERCTELILQSGGTEEVSPHLRLHDSVAGIRFSELAPVTASFESLDLREDYPRQPRRSSSRQSVGSLD